jgi:diguanylate cyclase (GGDEF)-like protein/PAS domain S-box-containing protein
MTASGDAHRPTVYPEEESTSPEALLERFQSVMDLSSDYYWEQDAQHRFTTIYYREIGPDADDNSDSLGKTRWELAGSPLGSSWEEYRALLNAREPIKDFRIRHQDQFGRAFYRSVSGVPCFNSGGEFFGYRGITRDISKEVENERWLTLERAVTSILVSADETADALRAAITAICESEGWDSGHYWGLDDAGSIMRIEVCVILRCAEARKTRERFRSLRFEPGDGIVGQVWESGSPLWVAEIAKDSRFIEPGTLARAGWKGAFLMPVYSRSKVVGVLSFYSATIEEPTERLLQIIDVMGLQLGNFYERAQSSARLRESEDRYSISVETAAVGICHVAIDGLFIHVNPQLCKMLGYDSSELLTMSFREISHSDDAEATAAERQRLHSGEIASFKAEKRYVKKNGAIIWVNLTVSLNRDELGNPLHDISIIEDISDRKRVEERVWFLANHDELTGLSNRTQFVELLEARIEAAARDDDAFALFFIDLDRFKVINDSLGHEAGDILLREVARRLSSVVRKSDVVGRIGGDEFVMIINTTADADVPASVARKILQAQMQSVELHGQNYHVSASIGIARYPEDGMDGQTLLRNADTAMYLAKEQGRNGYRIFSPDIAPMSVETLTLERHLRLALSKEEFRIHYQPRVDLSTGLIRGAEALLRWWNHELGTVTPAQFIPIAEEIGVIVPIGQWVLYNACRQNMDWQSRGLPAIVMAVNLSARQFADPELIDNIIDVLDKTGMSPELLELEITESLLVRDVDDVVRRLRAIKDLGVRLAIDDFGTGYSSLAQVKRFPIDSLKIDRSFIRDIAENQDDKAISQTIVALGHTLGAIVVAEGVETEEQYEYLKSIGCDELQGFYFSKPCAPDAFAKLIKDSIPQVEKLRVRSRA